MKKRDGGWSEAGMITGNINGKRWEEGHGDRRNYNLRGESYSICGYMLVLLFLHFLIEVSRSYHIHFMSAAV